MDLHRIEGKPEWADVPPANMNIWQKVASRSGGILTIGNYFSLLGLASVPFGLGLILGGRYIAGVIVLAAGRLCDMLDGYLADKTATKSPLGEKVDATFDKVSTGLALFVLGVSGLLPWPFVALLVLPHAVVGVLALAAYFKGAGLHPSRLGKLSMAGGWIAMLAFVAAYGFSVSVHDVIVVAAWILLAASTVLSVVATIGYIREYCKLVQAR